MCFPIITFLDVEAVLCNVAGPEAKLVGYSLTIFSKGKGVFMRNHYSLEINVSSIGSLQVPRLVVRTTDSPVIPRDSVVLDDLVSLEEVHFFDSVHPVLVQNYTGPRWSPACYLAKPVGLVFEDLRLQGFANRQDSVFDEVTLRSVLATLARFHATSIVTEAKLGRSLIEEFPGAFREKIYTEVG